MGNLQPHTRCAGEIDHFEECLQGLAPPCRRECARVDGEDFPLLLHQARNFAQLIRPRERAWLVLQAHGDTPRALVHRVLQEPQQLHDLIGVQRVGVIAADGSAGRAVAGQQRDILARTG